MCACVCCTYIFIYFRQAVACTKSLPDFRFVTDALSSRGKVRARQGESEIETGQQDAQVAVPQGRCNSLNHAWRQPIDFIIKII